jgi:DeoR family glycerol-3-phosphate regulon repressor
VAAIDAAVGAMDANFDEAQVARAMIDSSRHFYIVASAAKFGRQAAFRVCSLNKIDIVITDQLPAAPFAAALKDAEVDVRYAVQ